MTLLHSNPHGDTHWAVTVLIVLATLTILPFFLGAAVVFADRVADWLDARFPKKHG